MWAVKRFREMPGVSSSFSAEKYDAVHNPWGPGMGMLLQYIARINQTGYHAQMLFDQNKEPISVIVRC